eukprot:ctg_1028.g420
MGVEGIPQETPDGGSSGREGYDLPEAQKGPPAETYRRPVEGAAASRTPSTTGEREHYQSPPVLVDDAGATGRHGAGAAGRADRPALARRVEGGHARAVPVDRAVRAAEPELCRGRLGHVPLRLLARLSALGAATARLDTRVDGGRAHRGRRQAGGVYLGGGAEDAGARYAAAAHRRGELSVRAQALATQTAGAGVDTGDSATRLPAQSLSGGVHLGRAAARRAGELSVLAPPAAGEETDRVPVHRAATAHDHEEHHAVVCAAGAAAVPRAAAAAARALRVGVRAAATLPGGEHLLPPRV